MGTHSVSRYKQLLQQQRRHCHLVNTRFGAHALGLPPLSRRLGLPVGQGLHWPTPGVGGATLLSSTEPMGWIAAQAWNNQQHAGLPPATILHAPPGTHRPSDTNNTALWRTPGPCIPGPAAAARRGTAQDTQVQATTHVCHPCCWALLLLLLRCGAGGLPALSR
jgi:hypothetical protein